MELILALRAKQVCGNWICQCDVLGVAAAALTCVN